MRSIAAGRDDGTLDEVDAAVAELYPRLAAWHRWLHTARDPEGTGLVTVFHPWESGLDNSPRWDGALADVPMTVESPPGAAPTSPMSPTPPSARPTTSTAGTSRWSASWSRPATTQAGRTARHPFRMADVLFTAILAAADDELADLAVVAGHPRPPNATAPMPS